MRLKPDTAAFVLLLGFLTSIGPVSTDIFLPSLPSMAAVFGTTPAGAEATLTGYFFGFALAQIFHGPIADRIGRRPVLLAALAVYAVAAAACVVAPTIEILVAARVVQSVAAAAPIILARTIVRDIHAGVHASRILSIMGSITGLAPIVAPLLGGVLETSFGWQASFLVMAIVGVFAFVVVAVALPETLAIPAREPLSLRSIVGSLAVVGRDPRFRVYAALLSLAYSGIFTFLGVSSFLIQGYYGLSPLGFAVVFALGAAAYIGGTFLSRRLSPHRGLDGTMAVGAVLLGIGGIFVPVAVALGPATVVLLVIPMFIFQVGVGTLLPSALAAAITPFPERAGAASSLAGFLHVSSSAILLTLTGIFFGNSALLEACVIGATGAGALIVFLASARTRAG